MPWKMMSFRILSLLVTLSVQVSIGLAEVNNSSHFLHHVDRSERSVRNRRQISQCGESATLAAGGSTIIFSDNDGFKERCRWNIEGPVGSTLAVTCPNFFLNTKGCKREKLIFKEKGAKKSLFCGGTSPGAFQSSTNSLKVNYNRKPLKRKECSGGFVCQVVVN